MIGYFSRFRAIKWDKNAIIKIERINPIVSAAKFPCDDPDTANTLSTLIDTSAISIVQTAPPSVAAAAT
jgi:hypothetical protein